MRTQRRIGTGRWILTLALAVLATACGGGGGGLGTPPTADAGSPQTAPEDTTVTLSGTGTGGADPVASVLWTQSGGPTVVLTGADTNTPSFTAPKAPIQQTESLTFVFTVTDTGGRKGTDSVTITVTSDDFVVFLADKDTDEAAEIYKSDVETGVVTKLSGPLVANGNVYGFLLSPDGRFVAYMAHQDSVGVIELYVARTDGSGFAKASGPMVAGGYVQNLAHWAPDSSRIAYVADQDTDEVFELYTSRPDGTGNVKVNGALVGGGQVSFTGVDPWAPDSSRIAYVASQDTVGVFELYTSRPDGTGNLKVSGPLTPGGSVLPYPAPLWAPDASRIAYLANQDTVATLELYATLPVGGGTVKLSGPMTPGGSVSTLPQLLGWSPDSSRIAYVADQDTDTVPELYTSFANGTGNARVNPALSAGRAVDDLSWAPDSSRIAYTADPLAFAAVELFAAQPDGTDHVVVSGPLTAGGEVFGFYWAPDASRIAYNADQDVDNVEEVFTSFRDGTGNVKVSGLLPANTEAAMGGDRTLPLGWAPDSRLISLLRFGQIGNSVPAIGLSAPPDGTGAVEYTGTMDPAGMGLRNWPFWSPDGSRLLYVAQQDSPSAAELYVSSPDGSLNEQICGPLVSGGNVDTAGDSYVWSP